MSESLRRRLPFKIKTNFASIAERTIAADSPKTPKSSPSKTPSTPEGIPRYPTTPVKLVSPNASRRSVRRRLSFRSYTKSNSMTDSPTAREFRSPRRPTTPEGTPLSLENQTIPTIALTTASTRDSMNPANETAAENSRSPADLSAISTELTTSGTTAAAVSATAAVNSTFPVEPATPVRSATRISSTPIADLMNSANAALSSFMANTTTVVEPNTLVELNSSADLTALVRFTSPVDLTISAISTAAVDPTTQTSPATPKTPPTPATPKTPKTPGSPNFLRLSQSLKRLKNPKTPEPPDTPKTPDAPKIPRTPTELTSPPIYSRSNPNTPRPIIPNVDALPTHRPFLETLLNHHTAQLQRLADRAQSISDWIEMDGIVFSRFSREIETNILREEDLRIAPPEAITSTLLTPNYPTIFPPPSPHTPMGLLKTPSTTPPSRQAPRPPTPEQQFQSNCNLRQLRERLLSMRKWRWELQRSVCWQREELARIEKALGKKTEEVKGDERVGKVDEVVVRKWERGRGRVPSTREWIDIFGEVAWDERGKREEVESNGDSEGFAVKRRGRL